MAFSKLRCVALALMACLATPCMTAQLLAQSWNFDNRVFTERLRQDWLMQDVPNVDQRVALFTPKENAEAEYQLIRTKLDELKNSELKDDERLANRVPSFTEALKLEEPASNDAMVDASSVAVAQLERLLETLKVAKTPSDDPRWKALYYDVCRIRRARRLLDLPELCPKFVYTKHYVIGASHYAYTEDVSDEEYRDFSCDRRPGGQLCCATFAPDGTIRNEILVSVPNGTLRDPDVSWDADKILYAARNSFDLDDFHIYEYDMKMKTQRKITDGLGVADIEPIYLPDDNILFGSTRCTQITDCWWTEVSNFYTCNPLGHFMRRLTADQVTVNYPKLLEDGRIIYTRWDYNDRGQIYPQPLFQMNCDGTGQTEYYGNNSYFPTTIMHARGIPGTDLVLAIAAGHHTYQNGKLLLIDRSKGAQENAGATLIAPVRETAADKIDQYGQIGELFQYPYPLDESTLLCAYLPEGGAWKYDVPFGLYWFDHDGQRELLAFDRDISCGQPMPLVERERPLLRPSQVDLSKKTGAYYVQDVYEGPGLKGIERGVVKSLRVVALEFRPVGIRKNGNGGPAGGAMVCTPIAIDNATWDVKRVLGEVPVEEDGSAYFEAPAMTPVYFQLLDEKGDVVQTMRSWSTLQPGETFACVGCHEPKESVIQNVAGASGANSIALQKPIAKPTPFYTPGNGYLADAGFSFNRDIQPILDHHCVSCHRGGDGPMSLLGDADLSDRGKDASNRAGRSFSQAYINLTQNGNHDGAYSKWLGIQEGPELLPPYFAGAFKSPLVNEWRGDDRKVEAHREVKLDEVSIRKLALWIDLLVPYCGDYREENIWTPEERATYAYYWAKHEQARLENDANIELYRAAVASNFQNVASRSFASYGRLGGLADKEHFLRDYLADVPSGLAYRPEGQNEYRNVALNPGDVQGDKLFVKQYPHAMSNSEYGCLDEFAAKNVIDGKTSNQGHGAAFPSWGPNLRTDLWLEIDFGCDVEIDKLVLYLRADFPHDAAWKSATVYFSDGSSMPLELQETAQPQTFQFSKRRVRSLRITDFQTDEPLKWHGITELEVWGVTAR
ncbi:MAG: hypothetical protein Q4G03_01485 [Planctomycetia bacterium]|nr:hypothetical protein [Planctomycetia bacterium]